MISPRSRTKEASEDMACEEQRSPRDESTSPRSPRSLAGATATSTSSSKPKPDLRARALMSHKKMQEQFSVKKGPTGGQLPGGFSPMGSRVTPEEAAGRTVSLALEFIESTYGRRPTPAEARLIAEMLSMLQSQQRRQAQQEAAAAGKSEVDETEAMGALGSDNHFSRSPDRHSDGDALKGKAKDPDDKVKKIKKKKSKKGKGTKDKQEKSSTAKSGEKKEEKKKKKSKREKEREKKAEESGKGGKVSMPGNSSSSSSTGSSISSISGIGFGVELLGGRLEYVEETKDESENMLTLVSADALKLREIVYTHLKHALSTLAKEDRSPRSNALVPVLLMSSDLLPARAPRVSYHL